MQEKTTKFIFWVYLVVLFGGGGVVREKHHMTLLGDKTDLRVAPCAFFKKNQFNS